jgi:hypothetical protein
MSTKKLLIEYSKSIRNPNTDKASFHAYEEFYPKIIDDLKGLKSNILEVGIAYGAFLQFLHEALPDAKLHGMDINYNYINSVDADFSYVDFLTSGDQTDASIFKDIPMMDLIIDDASHISSNSISTFNILKEKIKPGGLYIIEDVWFEQLSEYPYEFLSQFEIVDLRHHKGRADDILLVYKK